MKNHSLACASVLLVLVVSAGCASESDLPDPEPVTTHLQLRDEMRDLWTAHSAWTRVYVIASIADLPDAEDAADRLLRNQNDLGDAIRPFYGDEVADELTALLREHVLGATDVLSAMREGDATRLETAASFWYLNANVIARLLAEANPEWSEAELAAMLRHQLDQTVISIAARLRGDWATDVEAYDTGVESARELADTFVTGLEADRPELVSGPKSDPRDERIHVEMRALWQDRALWTRVLAMTSLADLPDAQHAAWRLVRNQIEIANALRPYYGELTANRLAFMLLDDVVATNAAIDAAVARDAGAFGAAHEAWRASADDLATMMGDESPLANDTGHARAMVRAYVDSTIVEIQSRRDGDWKTDVVAFDTVISHTNDLADALSVGVAARAVTLRDDPAAPIDRAVGLDAP